MTTCTPMRARTRSRFRPALVLGLIGLGTGFLGVSAPVEAQLSTPPPPATATLSALESHQDGARRKVDESVGWGDRALHLGDPVAALEHYQHALDQVVSGLDQRADVVLRLANAEAVMGECGRALTRLAQIGEGTLTEVPERAAQRMGSASQIREACAGTVVR